jgi:hypothetical protein
MLEIGCCWFDIIVLNIHAPRDNKTGDVKDSFYDESEQIDKIPKYHKKNRKSECQRRQGRHF